MTTPDETTAGDDGWTKGVAAVTLFVDDLDAARGFYVEVFGKPIVHQDDVSAAFDFGTSIINLLATSAAPELVNPA
ncbi:MAG: VOC family protein, partial [Nocardioidaceae bacterium]